MTLFDDTPTLHLPLAPDAQGVIRVGSTRVTLQAVIADYQRGATAEDIVAHFPVLKLADVYVVLGYYLQERDNVEAYIQTQRDLAEAERLRHADIQAAFRAEIKRRQDQSEP